MARGRTRFHVPFHAGTDLTGMSAGLTHRLDYTELPALDVLGHPEGVLKASQEAVARLYGTRNSFYLINGASVGLMATLLAAGISESDGEVLVARNAHRSVIHGLILAGANPRWLLPECLPEWGLWGGIQPDVLEKELAAHPEIRVLVMTHPTYEGIPSAIDEIAAVCKRHHVCLIVDEAHGALWPLFDELPQSAIAAGADAVIHSTHKSAGSLTQTALLHLPEGSCLSADEVQQALNVLQTTSPSYPLLANLEQTLAWVGSTAGETRIQSHIQRVRALQEWINHTLDTIHLLPQNYQAGAFQLFLKSDKCSGEELGEMLEETYGLSFESVTPYGTLMAMNLGLPDAAFDSLKNALLKIERLTQSEPDHVFPPVLFELPQVKYSPRQAFFASGCLLRREDCVGRISKQVVAACPPGIPILIPGEVIQPGHLPHCDEDILVVDERLGHEFLK